MILGRPADGFIRWILSPRYSYDIKKKKLGRGILLTLLHYSYLEQGSGYVGELLRLGLELLSSSSCRGKLRYSWHILVS
jgi:hypothetical protein